MALGCLVFIQVHIFMHYELEISQNGIGMRETVLRYRTCDQSPALPLPFLIYSVNKDIASQKVPNTHRYRLKTHIFAYYPLLFCIFILLKSNSEARSSKDTCSKYNQI